MADPVSALAGQNPAQTTKAKATLAADFDAFLLLLTTQLKHQDPLSPLEPTEFTGQLVQFASVEQQIQQNENLEALVGIQNANLASSIIGFIGTNVEAEGSKVPLQNGQAKFTYDLPENVKTVVITITDESGKVMLTESGENTAGLHEFVWDGKDTEGLDAPDGAYQISVTPVGFEGQPVATRVHVFGRITGVSMENGTTLSAGGVDIPLDKILTIEEPTGQ